MSAIQMVCPECGGQYIAGVVGMTPWPAHHCPTEAQEARRVAADAERWDAAVASWGAPQ